MTGTDPRNLIASAAIEEGELAVEWRDGHRSRFHPLWLRHQCNCDFCGTAITAVRGLRLHHLPERLEPSLAEAGEDAVTLVWRHDGHRSCYAARWLRDHCYSDSERAGRNHRPSLWDRRIGEAPPSFDMLQAERDHETRLALLEAVRDYGFCAIGNAPTEAAEAGRLIELVGAQRQSHYGTYTLSKKKAVDNVGDTTGALDPHVDETYRLSTIGITVFQVLRPSREGGHSTLVDGFEAVRRLREAWPEDFELLTKVPITGIRRDTAHNSGGQTKWYAARLPMIRLDFDGEVSGVRLNERQIAPLDLPGELIEPCYRALRRIFEILYDPELRLTFPLKAGEGLIFDNQRVLHGRTAYELEDPPRQVLTSSVDIEEFHSSLRLLTEALHGEVPPLKLNQGMMA